MAYPLHVAAIGYIVAGAHLLKNVTTCQGHVESNTGVVSILEGTDFSSCLSISYPKIMQIYAFYIYFYKY